MEKGRAMGTGELDGLPAELAGRCLPEESVCQGTEPKVRNGQALPHCGA